MSSDPLSYNLAQLVSADSCIREVPGSNLHESTHKTEICRDFPQPIQMDARVVSNKSYTSVSNTLPSHEIIMSFETIY